MERKWTERKYYVQDNSDVAHQDVRMYCNINQFPALTFCGPHSKPHVSRRLGNHYHLRFDQKIGMGICSIRSIPCACVYVHTCWTNLGYMVYGWC